MQQVVCGSCEFEGLLPISGAPVVGAKPYTPAQSVDDSWVIGDTGAQTPKEQPHLCRAVRADAMNRLSLEGSLHIRDADFFIQDMALPSSSRRLSDLSELLIEPNLNPSLYAFAW